MSELDLLRTYRDQILTIAGRYGATDVRVFGAATGRMAHFNNLLGG